MAQLNPPALFERARSTIDRPAPAMAYTSAPLGEVPGLWSKWLTAASCSVRRPVTDWGGPAEPQRRLPAHKDYSTPIRRERSRARFYIIAKCRQTQDCLISLINSLMARFNSLLGRNKFPVLPA
jgi:hypothetical protein